MAYAPYTAEELARLRRLASRDDLGSMVHHLLATIDAVTAERDALRAERDALRDAAVRCLRKGAERLLAQRPSSHERLRLETALNLAASMLGEPRDYDGSCRTDGHYLCPECPHMSYEAALERGIVEDTEEDRAK